ELNYDMVRDYAQDMIQDVLFPPITIFYDGADYWLADGFHRYHAAKQICREAIEADVRQGTRRDAVLYSVGANATHGLRRTNADKRRAVETLLRDEEWTGWSDREIARQCGVSNRFVSNLRDELSVNSSQIEIPRTVQRNGIVYTMNTANIGGLQQVEFQEKQAIPLTQIEMQVLEPQPGPIYGTVYTPAPSSYNPPTQYTPPARTYDTMPTTSSTYVQDEEIKEILDEIVPEYTEALRAMDDAPQTEEVIQQPSIEPVIDVKEKRDA